MLIWRFSCCYCASSCIDRPLDVAILVDHSTYHNKENWQHIQSYLRSYVDQLGISADMKGHHVSLIAYSSSATVVFNFKASQSADNVKSRIGSLTRQAGYRRPDEALKLVNSDLFTAAGGARDEAQKVRHNPAALDRNLVARSKKTRVLIFKLYQRYVLAIY